MSGLPPPRNRPVSGHFTRCKIDHAHAAFSFGRAVDPGDTPISDVELRSITTGIETVRAQAGFDMSDLFKTLTFNQEYAALPSYRQRKKICRREKYGYPAAFRPWKTLDSRPLSSR